jgi:hypothetical protein
MLLPVESPFRFGALFWDARFDRYEKAQRYEAYLFDIPCTGTNRAFGLRVTKDGKTKDEGIRHSSLVIRPLSLVVRKNAFCCRGQYKFDDYLWLAQGQIHFGATSVLLRWQ